MIAFAVFISKQDGNYNEENENHKYKLGLPTGAIKFIYLILLAPIFQK